MENQKGLIFLGSFYDLSSGVVCFTLTVTFWSHQYRSFSLAVVTNLTIQKVAYRANIHTEQNGPTINKGTRIKARKWCLLGSILFEVTSAFWKTWHIITWRGLKVNPMEWSWTGNNPDIWNDLENCKWLLSPHISLIPSDSIGKVCGENCVRKLIQKHCIWSWEDNVLKIKTTKQVSISNLGINYPLSQQHLFLH